MNVAGIYDESYIEGLRKKWAKNIKAVESVRRSEGRNLDESEQDRLAILLETTDNAYVRAENAARRRSYNNLNNLDEATQVANVASANRIQSLQVITGVFPSLIAEELFSVQPITQKTAQVYWLEYLRGTQKGNLDQGGLIQGAFRRAGYDQIGYASAEVREESQAALGKSATSYSCSLDWLPVIPGTVELVVGSNTYKDNGKGDLISVSGNAKAGTIDYASGAVSLTTLPTLTEDADVHVNYEYNNENAPARVPELDVHLQDTTITARSHKLKAIYSLDAAYDIQQSQGIILEDELLRAAGNELRHETDGMMILDCYNKTTKSSIFVDNYQPSMGLSRRDFCMQFADKIHSECSDIFESTKRVKGNWVVVGKNGMDLLEVIGAPRFVAVTSTAAGPHFAGTLDGNIKVYHDPFMPSDAYLVGFKGSSLIDAGYVYAPYMMFFTTDLIRDENFTGRQGYATSSGKRMLEPDLYRKGVIVDQAPVTGSGS